MDEKPAGRPTKLTPELQEAILKAILAGVPRYVAAGCANVTARTFRNWLARGRSKDCEPQFREFRQAVMQAEASVATRNVLNIQKASSDDWRAAAWWLERRCAAFARERIPLAEFERRIRKLEKELEEAREGDEMNQGQESPRE
ncbi:hypothetical protein [Fimbriiglobus ruber]|nr:hypothetical protein [Fimbriiglobus ruber]